ncbi:MAG: MopE-related protein [Sandaracinus sp.]
MQRARIGALGVLLLSACGGEPAALAVDAFVGDGGVDAAAPMPDAGPDAACVDEDGDGHRAASCGGDDCDDADAARYPGNTESCDPDGHDEDCDPTTVGPRDADGDGATDAACCNGASCGEDCDDAQASVHVGATEACNSVDDDCDGATDETVMRTAYRDADGDLHGDPAASRSVGCSLPAGYSETGDDCDDARADRNPTTVEACDAVDNDCDTRVDEGVGSTYWPDTDGDGFGDAHGASVMACSAPPGYATLSTDCDDTRQLVNPATTELCDGLDNNCNGTVDESGPRSFYRDADGDGFGDAGDVVMITACTPPDGYVARSNDCNDGDPSVHPGGAELCDGLDGDCSLGLAGGGRDASEDRDGDHHAPASATCTGGPYAKDDCNDGAALIYGGAPELCDGLDDDCSTGGGVLVDEDADFDLHSPPSAACAGGSFAKNDCVDTNAAIHGGALELCDGLDDDCSTGGGAEPLEDADGDGHTLVGALFCMGGLLPRDDCDDTRATVYLGAPELCDGLDTDCRQGGGAAAAEDQDGDHHAGLAAACSGGPYAKDDCDDAVATTYGGAGELCNRVDDDCSLGGGVDAAEDVDGDGHAGTAAACSGGPLPKDDCVDTNAIIHTGAVELCDGLDDDCSIGGGAAANEDQDGDHHAAPSAACSGGPYAKDDCDDTSAIVYPGASEICDRVDDDCSSGGGVLASEDVDADGHAAPAAMCTGGPLPKDDCDDLDGTSYPGAPPVVPALVSPENGARTGSALAAASRRPTFRWRSHGGCGLSYDLQVDDSCTTAGFASCAFGSPEIDAQGLSATRYTPSSDLPVRMTAPVGTRYFWRVRQCSGATCSGWSAVRYVDVGRVASDYDGNGYSDVVADAMWQGTSYQGIVYAYYGAASGLPTTPSLVISSPNGQGTDPARGEFGVLGYAGDVDGDGYGDLVIGHDRYDVDAFNTDVGIAYLYRGGPSGLPASPSATIPSPGGSRFGYAVSTAGDVNADGYADVIIAAPFGTDGVAYVFHGSATGLGTTAASALRSTDGTTTSQLGTSVSDAGDVDGDGYGDVVLGCMRYTSGGSSQRGRLLVFRGSASGVVTASPTALLGPAQTNAFFGTSVAGIGDIDGDGYADIAGGAPQADGVTADEGAVLVFLGSETGVRTAVSQTIWDPGDLVHAMFGYSLDGAGDVDGDGDVDLLVGARQHSPTDTNDGSGFVIAGNGTGLSPTVFALPNPTAWQYAYDGAACAALGDVNADGYLDVGTGAADYKNPAVGGAAHEGNVFVYFGGASGPPMLPSVTLDNPTNTSYGLFGTRLQ